MGKFPMRLFTSHFIGSTYFLPVSEVAKGTIENKPSTKQTIENWGTYELLNICSSNLHDYLSLHNTATVSVEPTDFGW